MRGSSIIERGAFRLNQQLNERLVELRNQYRLQQLESEQRRHHVAQQLSHVDALLVEQLESTDLVESLIELRHQYQQQIAECDRRAAHCKEQLIHVKALLADQIVEQHEHPTLRATVEQQQSLKEAPDLADAELPKEGRWEKELDDQASSPSEEAHNGAAKSSFPPAAMESLILGLK